MPDQIPSFLQPDDPEVVFKKTPADPQVRIRELENKIAELEKDLWNLLEEKEISNAQLEEWQEDKKLIETLRSKNQSLRNKLLDCQKGRS